MNWPKLKYRLTQDTRQSRVVTAVAMIGSRKAFQIGYTKPPMNIINDSGVTSGHQRRSRQSIQ